MMRNIFLPVIFLFTIFSTYGQLVIIEQTIIAPPVPPSENPVDLNNGISVEYKAENEITLIDGFWVQENTGGGSTYFLASIVPLGSYVPPVSYAVLKNELDGGHYLVASDGLLRFKFNEEYYVPSNVNLQYKIYDKTNIPVSGHPVSGNFVQYGDNRFSISVVSLTAGEYYVLEVQNEKNEKWYLRFKVN